MDDILLRLTSSPWIPFVVGTDDGPRLQVAVDLDRGYDIREFRFPLTTAHLAVLRSDLARHLLLWCALEPACEDAARAGRDVRPDPERTRATIDVVLLGPPEQVAAALLPLAPVAVRRLVAHHADPDALERGDLFAALATVREEADWDLVHDRDARRSRAARGIVLTPLDAAVLRYTGRYLHPSAAPRRIDGAVDPVLLPEVLAVVDRAQAAIQDVAEAEQRDAVAAALSSHRLAEEATEEIASLLWFEQRRRNRG